MMISLNRTEISIQIRPDRAGTGTETLRGSSSAISMKTHLGDTQSATRITPCGTDYPMRY
eukprot:1646676-Rhodomonas_salina.1